MAERRSLGAALDLSPDKAAFIQSGPPPISARAPVAERLESPKPEMEAETSEELHDQVVRSEQPVRRSRTRRQARAPLPQGDAHLLGIANLLMPLTTRLQPTTAVALKRAGLEQKLRGQNPSTVQEIVEEAIQQWLRDFSYLS